MPPHIYDTHAHYYPDFYVEILDREGWLPTDPTERAAITSWSIEKHLQFMDANGVQKSCFSPAYPGASVYKPSPVNSQRNADLARRLNNYGHSLAKQYPNRISFLAVLPFPDEHVCFEEITRVEGELSSKGYCLFTEAWGAKLHDLATSSLVENIFCGSGAVFLHPHHSCTDVEQSARTSSAALAQLMVHTFTDIGIPALCDIVCPAVPRNFPILVVNLVNFTRLLALPSPFTAQEDARETAHDLPTALAPIFMRTLFFDLTTAGLNAFQTHVPSMLGLGVDHSRLLLGSAAPCGGWERAATLLNALSDGAQNYWGIETGAEECQAVRMDNAIELEEWQ